MQDRIAWDSIGEQLTWLIRHGWSVAALLCAMLITQQARPDSFARSMTVPGDDLQVNDELPVLLRLGIGGSLHNDDWHANRLSERLAYRSDHPQPGPQGGLVDKNLVAPRTWMIQDLFHGLETITTIVEKDRLCLDRYFYAPIWSYMGDLYQDNWYFYSRKSLLCLGANVGVAAALPLRRSVVV